MNEGEIKKALRDIFEVIGVDKKYADYAEVVTIIERLLKKLQ